MIHPQLLRLTCFQLLQGCTCRYAVQHTVIAAGPLADATPYVAKGEPAINSATPAAVAAAA